MSDPLDKNLTKTINPILLNATRVLHMENGNAGGNDLFPDIFIFHMQYATPRLAGTFAHLSIQSTCTDARITLRRLKDILASAQYDPCPNQPILALKQGLSLCSNKDPCARARIIDTYGVILEITQVSLHPFKDPYSKDKDD